MKLLFLTRAKVLKSLVIASAMMFSLASCQTGVDSLVPTETSVAEGIAGSSAKGGGTVANAEEIRTANAQLEEIAKAAAVVVADKETAAWLHKKCMEKFDGETNVLCKQLDEAVNVLNARGVAGGWSNTLASALQNNRSALSWRGSIQSAINLTEKALDNRIHLYWHGADKWDGRTAPLIAIPPVFAPDGLYPFNLISSSIAR